MYIFIKYAQTTLQNKANAYTPDGRSVWKHYTLLAIWIRHGRVGVGYFEVLQKVWVDKLFSYPSSILEY